MMNKYEKDRSIYNQDFNKINNKRVIITNIHLDTSYSGKLSFLIDQIVD